MATTTRYAKSGDVHIAYRTLGTGRVDVVVAEQWFSNVEIEREVRPLARFNDRLSAFARVTPMIIRGDSPQTRRRTSSGRSSRRGAQA